MHFSGVSGVRVLPLLINDEDCDDDYELGIFFFTDVLQ